METICLMLAYKIRYPDNYFMLRGNHECASINRFNNVDKMYDIYLLYLFNIIYSIIYSIIYII